MEIVSRIRSLLIAVFRRNRIEGDFRDELQFHLEAHVDDLVTQHGLSHEEAFRQARIKFGSIEKCKEAAREARWLHLPDQFMQNVRYALRQFRRNPGFTLAAVLTLALGIGANTAIFSIYHQVLLRPLPVPEPDRLVNMSTTGLPPGNWCGDTSGYADEVYNYRMFRDLERIQTVFTGIAAHFSFNANLAFRGETLNASGLLVSGSYFPVLAVRPALGRLLGSEDDRAMNESHVVVLSHAYWETRFGRNPSILNQVLIVNGQPMTIVGVAQRGFEGTTMGMNPQVFVPITMANLMSLTCKGGEFDGRLLHWLYLFARLKPKITMDQAQASINGQYHAIINDVEAPLQKDMSDQAIAQFKAKTILLSKGMQGQSALLSDETKTGFNLLLCLTTLLWIIACVNVINLLLARGAAREGEFAIRLSIGAGRMQVLIQLLTEYCLLALFAGAAAVLAAKWTLNWITLLLPAEWTEGFIDGFQFSLGAPALFFAAALTLGTGLLFGLFPALQGTRSDLTSPLKVQSGRQSSAKSAARFRTSLATSQIALSLTLLVVAGLCAKSLFNVNRIDLGMKADNLVTFGVSPSLNGYTAQRSLLLYERLEDELAAVPGVTGVANSLDPLLTGMRHEGYVFVEGYKMDSDTDRFSLFNKIGPAYFSTLGIPLISGREFTRSDAEGTQKVAIVNEAFADKFKLGSDAVGKHIGWYGYGQPDYEIVGLVKNAKHSEVKGPVPPLFFLPYRQGHLHINGDLTFYIRTSSNVNPLMGNIRKLVARLDPNLPVERLRTMPQQVRLTAIGDRAMSYLSTAFACLAILLTAVGLYGVLAYMVAHRTREIGLRIALGASHAQVCGMIFRQVGIMTSIGGIIGLILAVGLSRYMQSILYRFEAFDLVVFCGSAIAILMVGLIIGFIPALRASQVNPMEALRSG